MPVNSPGNVPRFRLQSLPPLSLAHIAAHHAEFSHGRLVWQANPADGHGDQSAEETRRTRMHGFGKKRSATDPPIRVIDAARF